MKNITICMFIVIVYWYQAISLWVLYGENRTWEMTGGGGGGDDQGEITWVT